MNEKIAIEILKQANIETTVGCCEKCPRKDKNTTCIGCLDDAKDILLNYIENLQSKIDKAIELIEKEDLIRYFRETNDIELANEFEDLYKNLKEDK